MNRFDIIGAIGVILIALSTIYSVVEPLLIITVSLGIFMMLYGFYNPVEVKTRLETSVRGETPQKEAKV